MPREYRVRWQREGLAPRTQIFQRERAARDKIERMLVIDELKHDGSRFRNMPDLVDTPTLQVREVTAWTSHERQPTGRPNSYEADVMAARIRTGNEYDPPRPPGDPVPSPWPTDPSDIPF